MENMTKYTMLNISCWGKMPNIFDDTQCGGFIVE